MFIYLVKLVKTRIQDPICYCLKKIKFTTIPSLNAFWYLEDFLFLKLP